MTAGPASGNFLNYRRLEAVFHKFIEYEGQKVNLPIHFISTWGSAITTGVHTAVLIQSTPTLFTQEASKTFRVHAVITAENRSESEAHQNSSLARL